MDDVYMCQFQGTEDDVKNYLQYLLQDEKLEYEDSFDYGVDDTSQMEIRGKSGIYAYNVFADRHTDYVAIPLDDIMEARWHS